jgi:hypothetical protein
MATTSMMLIRAVTTIISIRVKALFSVRIFAGWGVADNCVCTTG